MSLAEVFDLTAAASVCRPVGRWQDLLWSLLDYWRWMQEQSVAYWEHLLMVQDLLVLLILICPQGQ